jgi:hypothetical protein
MDQHESKQNVTSENLEKLIQYLGIELSDEEKAIMDEYHHLAPIGPATVRRY